VTEDARRLLRYKLNPWAFLMECCFTLDQVDSSSPIKTLPNREYARRYVELWQRAPLLAIPKSRRMTMSWFTIALYLWDTMFHEGRFNAFVSKKEDDAHELVERAKFIYEHIPQDKIPRELLPVARTKFALLEFPELQSKIQGFPQGADQLRQFTFSGIFGDECAFWEHAKAFYSASFPTIEGGGRMTLVSSPAPGFFKQLCFDGLDQQADINVSDMKVDDHQMMTGMRCWHNQKNKFTVLELHYTADPQKRHDSFRESIKNQMPLVEYLREYELHWDTFTGFPVYPEFSKLHITNEEPHPMAGLPMLVGVDFGLTPAAVLAQYQEDRLIVFEELVEVNMGSDRFAAKLAAHIKLKYRTKSDLKKDWLCFIDPAGLQKNQKDETSCAQSLMDVGFVTAPGPILWEARRKGVVHFLKTMTSQGPALQVYGRGCPVLVKGFEGGYHYAEKAVEIEPTQLRPLKNAYSHPHDAFQYLACGITDVVTRFKRNIPVPRYAHAAGSQAKEMRPHGRLR
jgi:hypothetical protein